MLSDHGTIGGYPKIATVITADYDKLVQLAPGSKIKFKEIGINDAELLFKLYELETKKYKFIYLMDILKKLPGPLLVFLGAVCLSFGGLIVKSFEGANLWQILFWRQLFFVLAVLIYLTMNYKKDVFKNISFRISRFNWRYYFRHWF